MRIFILSLSLAWAVYGWCDSLTPVVSFQLKDGGSLSLEKLSDPFVRLHDFGLSGPIPPTIKHLKNIKGLFLSQNKLSGDVPVELSSLKHLRELDLGDNSKLSGTLYLDGQNLKELDIINTRIKAVLIEKKGIAPLKFYANRTVLQKVRIPGALAEDAQNVWMDDVAF